MQSVCKISPIKHLSSHCRLKRYCLLRNFHARNFSKVLKNFIIFSLPNRSSRQPIGLNSTAEGNLQLSSRFSHLYSIKTKREKNLFFPRWINLYETFYIFNFTYLLLALMISPWVFSPTVLPSALVKPSSLSASSV